MSDPAVAITAPPRLGGAEFKNHWRALLGCMIAASVGTIGLNAYTNGAFVPELVTKIGYTREQLSLATLLLSTVVALISPFVGQAIDSWGAPRIIALSIIGEILGFAWLGAAPAQFPWFACGMAALALLGAGTTPPGFSRIVAAHFDRHRGLALGLMIGGLGATAISAPIVMTRVIAAVGWRGGYFSLAGLVFVFGGVGIWLIHRDAPPRSRAVARHEVKPDWSALRRPLYWWILLCFAAPALFGAGYLLHLITILRERGFTPGQAAQVQALIGVSVMVGRLTSGVAMDFFFAPYVAATSFGISAAGTVLLFSSQGPVLCLAALAIGLTIGAELDILAFVLSRYFGLVSFGRLYSLAYSFMIFAGGSSPLLIAKLSPDENFRPSITVSSIGILAAAIAVCLLPKFGAILPHSDRSSETD